MIVYFGTTLDDWNKICASGEICVATKDNPSYTEVVEKRKNDYGHIYLTNSWLAALEAASCLYSEKNTEGHYCTRQTLVVVKLNIVDDELKDDPDMNKKPLTDKDSGYYRVYKPIAINESTVIAGFKFMNYQDCCNAIDKWIDERENSEDIDKQIKWIKPIILKICDDGWNHDVF